MIIAYVSIISFSSYFYFHGVHILAYNGFLCLVLFIIFGIASYFTSKLVWLYRLAVLTTFHAFYFEVLFTGGALSPALMELIIPPIIAFFYRPMRDRYVFMAMAVLCILSIWPLSSLNYTKNYFPPEFAIQFHMIAVIFVLGVLAMYIYLYRRALDEKRKAIANDAYAYLAEKFKSIGVKVSSIDQEELANSLLLKKGIKKGTTTIKNGGNLSNRRKKGVRRSQLPRGRYRGGQRRARRAEIQSPSRYQELARPGRRI